MFLKVNKISTKINAKINSLIIIVLTKKQEINVEIYS